MQSQWQQYIYNNYTAFINWVCFSNVSIQKKNVEDISLDRQAEMSFHIFTNKPRHEKTYIFICVNKGAKRQISFVVTVKLIGAFVFATRTVQCLCFLNPKYPASSHFLCLYCSACVEPVRKPHCCFSHNAAQILFQVGFFKRKKHSKVKKWKQDSLYKRRSRASSTKSQTPYNPMEK